ncbi:hypothetical protein CVT26_000410, partial [Gymnopilus dilepis]
FQRIGVYFVGHSEPERGDLHFTIENQGANSIKEVFGVLFPAQLSKIIAASQKPALTLMTCGGVLSNDASVKDLREYSRDGPFSHILAFEQPKLQVYYLSGLLEKFALNRYIHNKPRLDASLSGEESTGAHTSISLFHKVDGITKYIWGHEVIRPFGQHPPMQCNKCAVFRSWRNETVSDPTIARLRCKSKGCTGFHEFKAPDGLIPVKGNNGMGSHGVWYKLAEGR